MNKKYFKWIMFCAIVIWLTVIWGNSFYPLEQSAAKSRVVVNLLSSLLDQMNIPLELRQFVVRKAAHFSEFFIMGMIWTLVFTKRNVLLPIGTSLLTALCDEGIQYFVPGRSCELRDVIIDLTGALLGITLVKLVTRIKTSCQEKKSRNVHQ